MKCILYEIEGRFYKPCECQQARPEKEIMVRSDAFVWRAVFCRCKGIALFVHSEVNASANNLPVVRFIVQHAMEGKMG